MTVQWLAQAFADLDLIVKYLLERNPEAALSVYEAIHQQVGLLPAHPQIGRLGRHCQLNERTLKQLPLD
jgi:plasmid stabilization system protein ParE